ncbi:type VI secretion system lipoprotein TssJ [Gilliamella sp. B2840]|uniref:type VI secretion system lipoprotein TssJ n=1 Tax=unclassified Gilliamella TaxID=2685620 RepID=UPI002269CBB3|nr:MULTISPECIES: type VI secretion system lipoprotein TssJ [unclassified Gilliamella]MCX8655681.1 type VI secretion system lipoprotein TssJ [Gilliamella sp. B2894]MCX8663782.1 type VI secretion system lipoprotein TssJ [Gilliamella sp. B2887]MCX8693620.1 type VI secretion system lipoprotein TssJ [Gilliamella sp. B2881]MCX8695373.1 type VI secretion system lipoprotein TssJ [Gilliamella sp. B2828]MCX8697820.1 type VI secretion system lipoprotein TssJ [Gilliamella sp. B3000]
MKRINLFIICLLTICLSGCGIAQSVTKGASSLGNSIFSWDIKTLHLDITARAELNLDDEEKSSPVVIRIYQLTKDDAFKSASYQNLVDQDNDELKATLLDTKEIVLKPNTSVSIEVPFDDRAKFAAVVALYKEPNLKEDSWRLILKRSDLHITKARKIEASKYTIKIVDED